MSIGPAVVVDTNVVASAVIARDATGAVARVLDGMLTAAFPFVVSVRLLAEYREVLCRPKFSKLHGLGASAIDTLLTDLAQHAIVMQPPPGAAAPDPGDQMLWDLLSIRADLQLVTGDSRLLRARDMRGRVISPREFLDARFG